MVADLGKIDYALAYMTQKEFVGRRKLGKIGDSLIICEHFPVFTVGRAGKDTGPGVLRVDRGGDITFHGPGQLVAYPIIDLKTRGRDMHRYLRDLEEVVIDSLARYSIRGERISGKTGVWASGRKLCSIGVAASGWVTYHGLSLNVNCDLKYFSSIRPCGMDGALMTSVEEVLGRNIGIDCVKRGLIDAFTDKFFAS